MCKNIEKPFEFFDVTADIGFYSYGNTLEQVFENAGLAMFNVISNTDDIKPVETKEISVTSEDKISLLYDFLEELLFMHEVEFMLFSQFDVAIKKDGENYKLTAAIDGENYKLTAAIKGEEINWEIHERGEEVKAITFHMMDIVKEGNLYKSSVILDL